MSPNPLETPPPSYSATAAVQPVKPTTYESPDDIKSNTIEATDPLIADGRTGRPPLTTVDDGGLPEVVVASASGSSASASKHVNMNSFPGSDEKRSSVAPSDVVSPVSPGNEMLVTPLDLLGDQSDWVDCPFCRRRVETKVKLDPSMKTHAAATGLFLTTIGGVVAPYKKKWKCHVTHICSNCDRKVAYKPYGKEMRALGTPEHLRQVSKFQAAPSEASRASSYQS